MKNIARGILFCVVVFSTALIYGGQEPSGVAEINVSVRQKSGKPVVTDARGNFTLGALPAGSYTLFVWARSAKEIQPKTGNVREVATSYSIKIEGAKRSANQSNQ